MTPSSDTIFALSSGSPPAAIAIVRVSGPAACGTAERLAGSLPSPRYAALRTLKGDGEPIDRGLVLWFPSDASVTGEDLVEFHLHGGRAVVARMLEVLGREPGLRLAEPGEFTRRGLLNGRMDLLQAEAVGDLLLAYTESERRAALNVYAGSLGAEVARWRRELLDLSAEVEALLDHSDEGDVASIASEEDVRRRLAMLHEVLERRAGGPLREELRDGVSVVLAGPPNSGKSSLLNALASRNAALVSAVPGTTRDVIEVSLSISGRRYRFADTAGLHETADPIEALGIARARELMATADFVIWLGDCPPPDMPGEVLAIHARCDAPGREVGAAGRLPVSATTGAGLSSLLRTLENRAGGSCADDVSLSFRQRDLLGAAAGEIAEAVDTTDLLIIAEHVRRAMLNIDALSGRVTSDDVLDTLFARFCVGK